MTKQQVAIGSKGNNTVAQGVKAKGGHDKVAALRAQFQGIAALFVATDVDVENAQATKLSAFLEGAEATANDETKVAYFRDAIRDAYLAKKATPNTAKVRTSEAMRLCAAYYLSVVVKTDKEGKETYGKPSKGERGTSGHVLIGKTSGYNSAIKVASKIKAAYGTKQGGHKTKAEKVAGKVWTKSDCIDALETLTKHVRVLPFDQQVLTSLGIAWASMKGKARAKVERTLVSAARVVPAILTNKNGKAVVKGSAQWQAMSRGQKAAATRRYHAHLDGQRQASNQTIQ